MHRRILSLALVCFLGILIINFSCTKLDTTKLGGDLLPEVDNVNTFADTFNVNATQSDFLDTTLVFSSDNHVLGNITSDPLFGKTAASVFFQLKPTFFPYAFANKDSINGFDSIVLCLKYQGSYGDTNQLQQLEVYEINDNQFRDSSYTTQYQPSLGSMIGSKMVDIKTLDDYMKYSYIKDSVQNQVRIKITSSAFLNSIYGADSSLTGTGNHAFYNDSTYRTVFKGLAVKPVAGMGNALMYINIADTNTKLEVHYRARLSGGRVDTTYRSFKLKQYYTGTQTGKDSVAKSATANYILRDRSGLANPTPNEIYLQAQPGTYANLTIPFPPGYSNRIIHRAELIVEQIPDNPFTDSIFGAPGYLYLDLKDTGAVVKYKPIYIDLNPNVYYDPDNAVASSFNYYPSASGPDYEYFGGFARRKTGPAGGSIIYYNINISRYVQQMVKYQRPNYPMRLYPAFKVHYGQYAPPFYAYGNAVAYGRVKVGTGNNPDYRMRVRVVYSPIK